MSMASTEKLPSSDGAQAGGPLHHARLVTVTSGGGGVALASEADAELLATMGYKQELLRKFSTLEVFGIAFSIMGLMPSIASTLSFSIPAGPAGMVWSWLLAGGCVFVVGLATADLGSAMPTSGGLYWWTHHLAPPWARNYLCFLVGYSNSLGLISGLCSNNYAFATVLCAMVVDATDAEWIPTKGVVYVVFLVCTLSHGIFASTLAKITNKMQTFASLLNVALVLSTIIALPVGMANRHNDGRFIFATFKNLTTWPAGWAFMMAWLSPFWTIGGFDSCVHMSEEASNAARAVPLGILSSIGMCWGLGFVIMIVIAGCMDPAADKILSSPLGQPMAQIYYDALGKQGALCFIAFLFTVQYLTGNSILVACSRQLWAFSRDGALPFATFFHPVSKTFGHTPVRAIWGAVFVAIVMGLISLIDQVAASALFSLGVAGTDLAFLIPILARAVWGRHKFVPGAFYTGGRASLPIAWAAAAVLAFAILLAMFPVGGPQPARDTMNYTAVVTTAVWAGASAYYLVSARRWFTGPRTTVGDGAAAAGDPPAGQGAKLVPG